MTPAIIESVIITTGPDGRPHIAPMGVIWRGERPVLAPFRPSATLENLLRHPIAVINHTDDARIFAGCLTGRRDWPTKPIADGQGFALIDALGHQITRVASVEEHPERPRFTLDIVETVAGRPFPGHNRAFSAVVEGAILVSRLDRLPREKIEAEMAVLASAVEKTAGPREAEAWGWLVEAVARHRKGRP